MSILLGSAYQAQYFTPDNQALTSATLTVTAPDGTITTPSVDITAGTIAIASVPATLPGQWLLVWSVATDKGQDVQQDQFSCLAPSLDLVSLGDLRDEINWNPNDRTQDAKLRRYLKAATTVISNITGPILPEVRTDVFDGDTTFVVLPYRWATSIVSAFETRGMTNYTLTEQPLGESSDAFGYTWDRTTNTIVRRAYGGATALFPPGLRVVSFTYMLGMKTIPDDIQVATTELIRHWWQFGQTPTRGPFSGQVDDDGAMPTVVGYAVPNRVLELLEPWRRGPGIF